MTTKAKKRKLNQNAPPPTEPALDVEWPLESDRQEWQTAVAHIWKSLCGRYKVARVESQNQERAYYGSDRLAGGGLRNSWVNIEHTPDGPGYSKHYKNLAGAFDSVDAHYAKARGIADPMEVRSNRLEVEAREIATRKREADSHAADDNKNVTPAAIPETQRSDTMKITETLARSMFIAMGFPTAADAEKWNQRRLEKKLNDGWAGLIEQAKQPAEGTPEREAMDAVSKALADGQPVELEDANETPATTKNKGETEMATATAEKKGKKKGAKAPKTTTASANGNGHASVKKGAAPAKGGKGGATRIGPTISGTILECLKSGPVAKDDIVKKLVKAFPDHVESTLRNTVAWNIATGLPRKGVKVKKSDDGKYSAK